MAYSDRIEGTSDTAVSDLATGEVGDFVALLKPRVMSLVVFTAFVGMAIAPGSMPPVIGFAALLAIAVGSGGSAALNMWYDADIDRLMRRTAMRPVPTGRVAAREALSMGLLLSVGSVAMLGLIANWVAAGLLAFTIAFYVVIYTMWLKRLTPQNIVIGGAAGAMPPVVGWAVATGTVSVEGLVLFAIVFLWTPPHFWALALYRSDDYRRAGVPMLPVVRGAAATKRQILAYAVALAMVGTVPAFIGMASVTYGLVASILGGLFVWLSWQTYRMRQDDTEMRPARRLFGFSLLYLFLLFAVLLVERGLGSLV